MDLNQTISDWLEAERQAAGGSIDFNGSELTLVNNGVPWMLPMLAGDILFSLRSALDCCWMGLKRTINPKALKGTLPRGDTRDEVKGTVDKTSMEGVIQGVTDFICDFVRPYEDGREAIWFVGKVDNWNKHNMIVLTLQRTTLYASLTNREGGSLVFEGLQYEGTGRLPVALVLGGAQMDTEPHASIDIILESRKPVDKRPLVPFLTAALKETDEIVQGFIAKFGKAPS